MYTLCTCTVPTCSYGSGVSVSKNRLANLLLMFHISYFLYYDSCCSVSWRPKCTLNFNVLCV